MALVLSWLAILAWIAALAMLATALALSSRVILLLAAPLGVAAAASVRSASVPSGTLLAAACVSWLPTGVSFCPGVSLGGVSGDAITRLLDVIGATSFFLAEVSRRCSAFLVIFLCRLLLALLLGCSTVGVCLKLQAAFQTPAGAGDVLRIQGQPLLLCHFDVDTVESGQETSAAVRPAAGTNATQHRCFVTDANLQKLHPNSKQRGQITQQLPKIHPPFRRKLENQQFSV